MNQSIRIMFGLIGLCSGLACGCRSGGMVDSGFPVGGVAPTNASFQQPLDPQVAQPMAEARALERSGQIADSLQCYVRIAEQHPELPLVWHRMAVAYDKVGRAEYAATCYQRALMLDPNNAEILCDCGYGRYLQGDLASAEKYCRQAVAIDPSSARAHNNLGFVLAKSANGEAAMDQFRQAGCDRPQAAQTLELVRGMSVPAPQSHPTTPLAESNPPTAAPIVAAPEITSPVRESPTYEMASAAQPNSTMPAGVMPMSPLPMSPLPMGEVAMSAAPNSPTPASVMNASPLPSNIRSAYRMSQTVNQPMPLDSQSSQEFQAVAAMPQLPSLSLPADQLSTRRTATPESVQGSLKETVQPAGHEAQSESDDGVHQLLSDMDSVEPETSSDASESVDGGAVRHLGDIQ